MQVKEWYRSAVLLGAAAWAVAVPAADLPPSMVVIERFAAERGDPDAQFFMGEHYEHGDSGVEKDPGQALALYRKAAAQGHGGSLFKLGQFHEQGLGGLKPDPEEAREWYRRAAAKGYAQARQRLADLEGPAPAAEPARAAPPARAEAGREKAQRPEAPAPRSATPGAVKAGAPAPATPQPAPPAAAQAAPVATQPAPAPKPAALDAPRLLDHVLAGKWFDGGNPAEFLPAHDAGCLKTGDAEVTCFSRERRRAVGSAEVAYSLKSVLRNFADQRFEVEYTYHVSAARGAGEVAGDDYGLMPQEGWQPAQRAACQLKQPGRLECRGARLKAREFLAR